MQFKPASKPAASSTVTSRHQTQQTSSHQITTTVDVHSASPRRSQQQSTSQLTSRQQQQQGQRQSSQTASNAEQFQDVVSPAPRLQWIVSAATACPAVVAPAAQMSQSSMMQVPVVTQSFLPSQPMQSVWSGPPFQHYMQPQFTSQPTAALNQLDGPTVQQFLYDMSLNSSRPQPSSFVQPPAFNPQFNPTQPPPSTVLPPTAFQTQLLHPSA